MAIIEKLMPRRAASGSAEAASNAVRAGDYLPGIPPAERPRHLLTLPGHPLDMGDGVRQIAALYADGTFLVSESHVNDPAVATLEARARKLGFPVAQAKRSAIEEIHAAYAAVQTAESAAAAKALQSQMRNQVMRVIETAASLKASDLHLRCNAILRKTVVRVRIEGLLRDFAEWTFEEGLAFCAAMHNMADQTDSSYQPYEVQAARIVSREDVRLPESIQAIRLAYVPLSYGGRAMVARFITRAGEHATNLTALGYAPHHIEQWESLMAMPQGVVIVSGPTGSGKTTTLARVMTIISARRNHEIAEWTAEDPIEIEIPTAGQIPITNAQDARQRKERFTKTLNTMLRLDPDVIMTGETRDAESAKLLFEAAMTGHLVLTTLHANNARQIIDRLRDLAVEPFKLDSIAGLVAQRLVRKTCRSCAVPWTVAAADPERYDLQPPFLARFERLGLDTSGIRIKTSKEDCPACGGTGIEGRTVLAEMILPDETFIDLYRSERRAEAFRHWIGPLAGRTMTDHAIDLIREGTVDPREAERALGPLDRNIKAQPSR